MKNLVFLALLHLIIFQTSILTKFIKITGVQVIVCFIKTGVIFIDEIMFFLKASHIWNILVHFFCILCFDPVFFNITI